LALDGERLLEQSGIRLREGAVPELLVVLEESVQLKLKLRAAGEELLVAARPGGRTLIPSTRHPQLLAERVLQAQIFALYHPLLLKLNY